MKSLDRIPFLANVLIVACSRPNAEVGKLVKALVTYATDGKRTDLDDIRLEAYFDLIAQDLDSLRMAAEQKSRKCSESAKCRTARYGSSSNGSTKKANAANVTTAKPKAVADLSAESSATNAFTDVDITVESSELSNGNHPKDTATIGSIRDFNAADVTSSFEQMKECYKKIGDNESQALAVWQQLSDDERTSAFAHVQRLQGDLSSRSYLYVYLRDKEWTKATSPVNQ